MFNENNPYLLQVRFLLELLPYVSQETDFALKGGTAINLFVRDMPRLSVDIDLAYHPLKTVKQRWRVSVMRFLDFQIRLRMV